MFIIGHMFVSGYSWCDSLCVRVFCSLLQNYASRVGVVVVGGVVTRNSLCRMACPGKKIRRNKNEVTIVVTNTRRRGQKLDREADVTRTCLERGFG